MMQQVDEKFAPFKWYNYAPLGEISGCIKTGKRLKKYFLTDDSSSGLCSTRYCLFHPVVNHHETG